MTDPDGASTESAENRLARWLRALAYEVERDPALAARVAEAAAPPDAPPESSPTTEPPSAARHTRRSSRFGPPTIAGRAHELGTGVPDPFAVRASSGEEGLRRALLTLRAGSLHAIIRVHDLDPQGKLGPNVTEQRLVNAIVAATRDRASRPPASPKSAATRPKKSKTST